MKLLIFMLEGRRAFVHIFFCFVYFSIFFMLNWRSGGINLMHALTLILIGGVGIGIAYLTYYLMRLGHGRRKPLLAILYFLIAGGVIGTIGYHIFIGSANSLSVQIVDHSATHTTRDYVLFFGPWYVHLAKYGVIFYFAEKLIFESLDLLFSRYWPRYVIPAPAVSGPNQLVPHFFHNLMHRVFDKLTASEALKPVQLAHLSNLVKYGTTKHFTARDKLATLEAEIAAVRNMLAMEEGHPVRLQINGSVSGIKVPPMLLLSIAKNMVKHGEVQPGGDPGLLEVRVEGGRLHIIGTNGIRQSPRWSRQDGGNGLQHMRQLLKSVYGNRAALYTHATDGYFYLYLHIDDLNPYDHGK